LDIFAKTEDGTSRRVSPNMDAAFEVVAGLAGTLNGLLFLMDPAVLAIRDLKWREMMDDDETRPRPYVLSKITVQPPPPSATTLRMPRFGAGAWSTRSLSDDGVSVEDFEIEKPDYTSQHHVDVYEAERQRRFRDVERDLRGL